MPRVLESSRDTILELAGREAQEFFADAVAEPETLDEIDLQRYRLLGVAQLRNIEIAFLMNVEGVLDDETFEVFASRARTIVGITPESQSSRDLLVGFSSGWRRFVWKRAAHNMKLKLTKEPVTWLADAPQAPEALGSVTWR